MHDAVEPVHGVGEVSGSKVRVREGRESELRKKLAGESI
jgi:hypothetical protein